MSESTLHTTDRSIVTPGEVLATGMDYLPGAGTYRLDESIHAERSGLIRIDGKVLKIIPLAGRYMPKRDDTIICRVIDVLMSGWRVYTNSAYSAVLPLKDASEQYIARGARLDKYFALGDYMVAKVTNVTSQKLIDIGVRGPGLRKLSGGRIIEINSMKVPRVIGKQGSMVSMIKSATGCKIIVGQNGLVWIEGEAKMENITVEVIKYIEKNSHKQGLTEEIEKLLTDKTGNSPKKSSDKNEEEQGE